MKGTGTQKWPPFLGRLSFQWGGVILAIFLLVTRLLGSKLYDAMEDELLAIDYNLTNTQTELLLKAPDATHPGLWYALFDPLVSRYGYTVPIEVYRYWQVAVFIVLLIASYVVSHKTMSNSFRLVFFGLIATNAYLVHLTFQYRMYGLALGMAVLFSVIWHGVVTEKIVLSTKLTLLLALSGLLGFFTSYSFIWLVLVWPLTFILAVRAKHAIQKIVIFFLSVGLGLSWFIPTFMRNAQNSIQSNQWAESLSFGGLINLGDHYFGIIPKEINSLHVYFLLVLSGSILVTITWSLCTQKSKTSAAMAIGLLVVFSGYLMLVFTTSNSLLYARVSMPLVIVLYLLVSHAFIDLQSQLKAYFLIMVVISVQLAQLMTYLFFMPDPNVFIWNFRTNPLKIVQSIPIVDSSCLVAAPFWNKGPIEYFADDRLKIVDYGNALESDTFTQKLAACNSIYFLDQTTVATDSQQELHTYFGQFGLNKVEVRENQALYQVLRP